MAVLIRVLLPYCSSCSQCYFNKPVVGNLHMAISINFVLQIAFMSLLCGCAGRVTGTDRQRKMSKLRQPSSRQSTSRFGFNKPTSTSSPRENGGLSHSATEPPRQEPSLVAGLTLDPAALLDGSYETRDSMQTYLPRKPAKESGRARPLSSVVTICQTEGVCDTSSKQPQRCRDDTNPTGKPKSGLKSFLARPFTRDKKPNPCPANEDLTGRTSSPRLGNRSMNGSQRSLAANSTHSSISTSSLDAEVTAHTRLRQSPVPNKSKLASPSPRNNNTSSNKENRSGSPRTKAKSAFKAGQYSSLGLQSKQISTNKHNSKAAKQSQPGSISAGQRIEHTDSSIDCENDGCAVVSSRDDSLDVSSDQSATSSLLNSHSRSAGSTTGESYCQRSSLLLTHQLPPANHRIMSLSSVVCG